MLRDEDFYTQSINPWNEWVGNTIKCLTKQKFKQNIKQTINVKLKSVKEVFCKTTDVGTAHANQNNDRMKIMVIITYMSIG